MGIPDILASINGRFVGIEVKASNGRPSELQLWNIEKIKESGGIAMVLYPKDFDLFKELVYKLKAGEDCAGFTFSNRNI